MNDHLAPTIDAETMQDVPASVSGAAAPAPMAVEIRQVSKTFPAPGRGSPFTALQDISLRIEAGTVVSLVGPSGCGKSTLLNMVAGLESPTTGEILQDGRLVLGINTEVGYITQRDNLLPWRSVERNVGLALELQRVPRAVRRQRTAEILRRVGLEKFGHYYPGQLSGGMRKRATLARTFIYEPDTLLMDEPFGALDAQLRVRMQGFLLELCQRGRQTVLFVTHDLDEAVAISDRVVLMGTNPGRIIHDEIVKLPRPRNVLELRSSPEFVETVSRLWGLLASEVDRAFGEEEVLDA